MNPLSMLRKRLFFVSDAAKTVSSRASNCCELRASERNQMQKRSEHWVSLQLTEILFVSSKRIS